ncbi:conserved protein of unknown function [Pseudomonas sp. JV551A1]|uniref:Uncharacterized protein n=1 Tax=Pseudomonas inefficax TaxID=2078786 RepID=A0AAQ1ST75_9PSED|nr:conserved protein of unknown function [Pseudomonas sp. JV551A1]SPO60398.1 conserved protein of unknown function [Pseudomonas inefficax]
MDLAYHLRMRFGTSHFEPNQTQLREISREVAFLRRHGINLDDRRWAELVKKHCPSAGTFGYRGADTSDLSTLLALALQVARANGNG